MQLITSHKLTVLTDISVNVSKHINGAKISEPTSSASRRATFKSSNLVGVTHFYGDLRFRDLAWQNVSSFRLSAVYFRVKSTRPIIYEGIIGTGRVVLFFLDP